MRLNHVTILVNDKKKAEKFYTEILGLKKFERDGKLWIRIGDQFIHITANSGEPAPGTFYHFGIEIKGLKEFIDRLMGNKIKVLDINLKPIKRVDVSRNYFIRDPDGNLLEFIESGNKFFNP